MLTARRTPDVRMQLAALDFCVDPGGVSAVTLLPGGVQFPEPVTGTSTRPRRSCVVP